MIKKYKMNNKVNEKGYHNRALTDEQKLSNREKSKQGQEWNMYLVL